jgi:hypothetical protein
MSDEYSDVSMLSEEEQELVRRARADHERLHANRHERETPMPPDKTDFPVGIRPDGSVNPGRESD